ncbi:transporter [Phragmitibacter flavus]|nr:transporter [Phragmitibacter flavus]
MHLIHQITASLLLISTVAAQPRELSTDRPDTTESASTVPKGFVQIETELAAYGHDGDTNSKSWAFGEFNFKYGVTDSLDLQLVVSTWQRVEQASDIAEGFGDISVRAKFNLWGNDGGKTALALMPFVTFPTGSDGISSGGTEAGLIIPLAIELPEPFGLGLMTEIDAVYDETTDDHSVEWVNSIVLGIDLIADTGAFIEFVSISSFASDGEWLGYLNTGLTWQPLPDQLQFDGGIRIGTNRAAEDLVFFVGCSTRF